MPEEKTDLERMRDTADDFHRLFDSDIGLRVLNHLAYRFYYNRTTRCLDTSGRLDPWRTEQREGMRQVVIYINDMINFDFSAAQEAVENIKKAAEQNEVDDFAT